MLGSYGEPEISEYWKYLDKKEICENGKIILALKAFKLLETYKKYIFF